MDQAGWPASSPAAVPLLPAVHLFSSSAYLTAGCGLGKDRAPVPCSPRSWAGFPGSLVMRCLCLELRCSARLGKWHGGGDGRLLGGGDRWRWEVWTPKGVNSLLSWAKPRTQNRESLCPTQHTPRTPRSTRPRRFPTSSRVGVEDKALQGVMPPRGGALGRGVLPLKLAGSWEPAQPPRRAC